MTTKASTFRVLFVFSTGFRFYTQMSALKRDVGIGKSRFTYHFAVVNPHDKIDLVVFREVSSETKED